MKTIAIISTQAFSLVNFRGSLIKDIVNFGGRVIALASDYDETTRQKIRDLGAEPLDFNLSRTGMNPLHDFIDTFRLALLLRRFQVDATLCYFIKPVIFGTLAAWMAGVQQRVAMIEGLGYVFTDNGQELSYKRKLLRNIVSWLYRIALARAEVVVFLNSDDISDFLSAGLVSESKVVLLGGIGVDLAELSFVPNHIFPISFLMIARLLREKGVVEFAEAARAVKARHPDVRFVLLGGLDSNPGSLTRTQVDAWVSESILEWPGHVQVKPWLEKTSVFVLPSYREGVPRSTQEAMALGRAVITTDVPGCRETVVEGINGYFVPVRDSAALAAAMFRFIDQPELIEKMGRASRQIAEERFDARRINAKMISILMR